MYESSKIAGRNGEKFRSIIYRPSDLYIPEVETGITDENHKLSLFCLYLRSPLGEKGEEISPTLSRTPRDSTLLNETRARRLLKLSLYNSSKRERERSASDAVKADERFPRLGKVTKHDCRTRVGTNWRELRLLRINRCSRYPSSQ